MTRREAEPATTSARLPLRENRRTVRFSFSWSPPQRRRPPPPPPREPPPPPLRDGAERDVERPALEPPPPLAADERWLDCPRLMSRCPLEGELAPLNALLREPEDMLELEGRDPAPLPWPPERLPAFAPVPLPPRLPAFAPVPLPPRLPAPAPVLLLKLCCARCRLASRDASPR